MKIIPALLFSILICVTILGCSSQKQSIYEVVNDVEEITIEIKEGTLSNTGATVIIRNNRENDRIVVYRYYIEKKIGDIWYQVPYVKGVKEPVIFFDGRDLVNENTTTEFVITWESLYGELEQGKYRIIRGFCFDDGVQDSRTLSYVAIEFDVG